MSGSEGFSADRGDNTPDDSKNTDQDRKMLDRIQERWKYMNSAWKDIIDQAEKDDRALSISGPWSDEDRAARDKEGRPCIHLDQISQYIHALVNEVRSNPIGVKVDPAGVGSDKDTGELRSNRIRQIEYECNGIQAYQSAFESAARRSFGAAGVKIEYKSWSSNQRVIKIRRFANSYSVIWDPDTEEADYSDMDDAFVLSRMSKKEFERKFGMKAAATSFGEDELQIAEQWIDDDSVQVAEYWYIDYKKRTQLVFSDNGEEIVKFLDEFEGGKVKGDTLVFKDKSKVPLISSRIVQQPQVKMCLTNGVAILPQDNGDKYFDWPGRWIPIGICVGEEDYVRSGSEVKKVLNSYIRRARDGQMLFDFCKTNMAETLSMNPKIKWAIYEGQDEGHEDEWKNAHRSPITTLHVKAITDEAGSPERPLPLPRPEVYEPPIQALEIAAESSRRAIQSAMASYGVTRQDDTNVKSGVALKQLETQNQLGAFHFIDNYKTFLRHMGRIINDLLDDVEGDKPMSVGTRNMQDDYKVVPINQRVNGKMSTYSLTDESQHEVTISTGPSFQSQRAEATEIVDTLVRNLEQLPVDVPTKAKILALLIKLKQLGPIGDELVKTFAPDPGEVDPQQLQAELQQWQQLAEQLGKQIEQLQLELKYKMSQKELDANTKLKIAAMEADIEKLKIMADTMSNQNELDSKEAINTQDAALQREMKSVDKDIAKMSKSGDSAKKP